MGFRLVLTKTHVIEKRPGHKYFLSHYDTDPIRDPIILILLKVNIQLHLISFGFNIDKKIAIKIYFGVVIFSF